MRNACDKSDVGDAMEGVIGRFVKSMSVVVEVTSTCTEVVERCIIGGRCTGANGGVAGRDESRRRHGMGDGIRSESWRRLGCMTMGASEAMSCL